MHLLSVDIGGTATRVGIGDRRPQLIAHVIEPTASDVIEVAARIETMAAELCRRTGLSRKDIDAVAIGVPGVVSATDGTVQDAPNVVGLNGRSVQDLFSPEFPPIGCVENDVNLAAVGEHAFGAARHLDDFVFFSIGTGTGLGIFVRGELLRGAGGRAGEVALLPNLVAAEFPDASTFEEATSGSGVVHHYQSSLRKRTGERLPAGWTAKDIFRAAGRGDEAAMSTVTALADQIAAAIRCIAAVLDPQLFVLGGGIGGNPRLLDAVGRSLAGQLLSPPSVTASRLGDLAGLHGGLCAAARLVRAGGKDGR